MNPIVEFFITLFESFGLYSAQNGLGEHLRGLNLTCDDYTNQSIYAIVVLWMFGATLIFQSNYYYGVFNKVAFARRTWLWLLSIVPQCIIVFLVAFMYSYNDWATANVCPSLVMSGSDCWGFGITAALCTLLLSVLFSYIIRWKSTANKTVPTFPFLPI